MSQHAAAVPHHQPYMPYVMMPVIERNGLGAFGFIVALLGLAVPTGIVSFLGLLISLAAIGRRPRGLAATGVVLGLLGTAFWAAVMIVAVLVALVGAVAGVLIGSVAFALVQPEVVEITSDMVNVAIAARHHEETRSERAGGLDQLGLSVAATTDPWGRPYRYELTDDDPGFDLVSAGQDGVYGTSDDVALSGLDRVWERAFDEFGAKMEQLGRKMESMHHGRHAVEWDDDGRAELIFRGCGERYYRKAVAEQ